MIKYFFSFLIVISFLQVTAQDILMSEEQPMRTDCVYEIIGKIGNKVLLFKDEANEFTVQIYDDKMESVKESKLDVGRSYLKFIGITATSKDFTVIYSHKDKGDTYLKANKYNSQLKLLDTTTISIFERRSFAPIFTMAKSQNKQYVLMYNIEKEKILETIVFDTRKMEKVWEHTFAPKDYYHRRDFIGFLVDNHGGGHLIVERDNEKSKKASNRFEFYSFDKNMVVEDGYLMMMSEYLWYDVYFDYDNLHNKIVAGGLFANDFQTKTEGYFYLNINPKNTNDFVLTYQPFEPGFIQEVLGKEKPTKKDGFSEVDIREIVLRRDGGILLITERNRMYVRQTNTMAATYSSRDVSATQTDYYYDDLLVFSIHPTGQLHWKDILHKKQYSQDDNAMYSSYFLLKTRSNLRFLYNDEIKQEGIVNEYIVAGEGIPDRKNIMNTQGVKLMLVMKNAVQVSADEVIIPSERRRQLKLVKLTY
jgi:hypothetical protein